MIREEYELIEGVSQSELKRLLNPIPSKEGLYFEEKETMLLGSLIDTLLTSESLFDQLYYISQIESKPSDTIKSIVHMALDLELQTMKPFDACLIEAANEHAYFTNRTDESRLKTIYKAKDYIEEIRLAKNKTLISKEEKELADLIISNLVGNDKISSYLNGEKQFLVTFEVEGIKCKGLLDVVNFKDKVIQPIDLKITSLHTTEFAKVAKRFRYDIQGSFYTEGIQQMFPEHTVLPFKFIVESSTYPGHCPLIYTMTEEDLMIGKHGYTYNVEKIINGNTKSYVETVPGFIDLINRYKWHMEKDQWDLSKEVIESRGDVDLNLYGKWNTM